MAMCFINQKENIVIWNFDIANHKILLNHFNDYEKECSRILSQSDIDPQSGNSIIMVQLDL